MIKAYYMLTKPGILMGNIITTAGGFALASKGQFNLILFALTMLGLCLIIGSACVFNNVTDRHYDAKMERTKNRALVKGTISISSALAFGILLAGLGFWTLYAYTNLLTASVAFAGFFFYVVMYSFWKYRSTYGTLIGSVAGALPPVIGYCAVSNQFDIAAALLFIIMIFWQMPHFYAIAMFRLKDYAAASIPVLPVKKGMHVTKIRIILYTIGFVFVSLSPMAFGYTGPLYFVVILLTSLIWLYMGLKGLKTKNDTKWARGMFRFSLVVIMAFSLMIGISGYMQ